jgi:hypothetical protein
MVSSINQGNEKHGYEHEHTKASSRVTAVSLPEISDVFSYFHCHDWQRVRLQRKLGVRDTVATVSSIKLSCLFCPWTQWTCTNTRRHTAAVIWKLWNWCWMPLQPCPSKCEPVGVGATNLLCVYTYKNHGYIKPNVINGKSGYKWKTTVGMELLYCSLLRSRAPVCRLQSESY